MIRLFSIEQALGLRGIIPELAVTRALQFMGSGYSPQVQGHIVVLEEGDAISQITEIGPGGLHDEDGLPTYDFIEAFPENGHAVYEVVFQIDDSRTVAVIIPGHEWVDPYLRLALERATGRGPTTITPATENR